MSPDPRATAMIAALCWGLLGCSASQSAPKTGHEMTPGAAHISIDGRAAAIEQRVSCEHNDFWTTLRVGGPSANLTAVLHNATTLTAESLILNNIGGFTGSYWADVGSQAHATMTGASIDITAAATGFRADRPSKRITAPIQLAAMC